MKANAIRVQYTEGGAMEIVLTTPKCHQTLQEVTGLKEIVAKGKELDVSIKQYVKKKSKDANSYCWVLCQKIGEVIKNTKEFVYQTKIKDVGQFEIFPIKDEAVERWINNWSEKGLGWFAESLGDSKIKGYTNVISYFGSSVYNSKEMSVLLEEIVREAKELGIETMPDDERKALLSEWGNR
jgi:hypothetical protein